MSIVCIAVQMCALQHEDTLHYKLRHRKRKKVKQRQKKNAKQKKREKFAELR